MTTTRFYDLPFFRREWGNVSAKLGDNYQPTNLFRVFDYTPNPEKTRVIILGQDPYPTPGHPDGLAFSVKPTVTPLPRSLQNIFKELVDDIGCEYPKNGSLCPWAEQGVLLLNTCLSCIPFQAGSHRGIGWHGLIKQMIQAISDETKKRVFILWGNDAQAYENFIDPQKHLILKAPHPSPLSAHYGFFGSKPFSKTNAYLDQPIIWGEMDESRYTSSLPTPNGVNS